MALPHPKHFVKNQIPDSILNDATLNAAISLPPANLQLQDSQVCLAHPLHGGKACRFVVPEGPPHADMLVSNKLREGEELNDMVPDLYDGEVGPDFSLQLGQENHAVYYLAYFQPSAFGALIQRQTRRSERAWMNLAFLLSSPEARSTHVIWLSW
nr:diphthamide biosynthesis protein 1 [Ipomoea batatas]